jgi:putative DNA-invertase from lambdoid prophage Rac
MSVKRKNCDLSSLRGRVMFSVIAAMADFERELIRERVQAGLRRARAHRKPLERPPRVFHRDRVLPLRQAGKTIRAIAQELGVSRRAVQRILKAAQKPLADFCCPTEAISHGPPPA